MNLRPLPPQGSALPAAPHPESLFLARLCEKHGIESIHILAGLAAGLHFAPGGDDASCEVAEDARKNGLVHTLATYCGIGADTDIAEKIAVFYSKIKETGMADLIV